jgi:eukaryotic-like serine/threonine-protein kinase
MDSQLDEIQIFTDAIAIADSAARSAFLSQICKNNLPLQERLERLISAHLNSVAVLDEFSLNSTNWEGINKVVDRPFEGTVEAGTVIAGRYTLMERIGKGGMGEVWVAQQVEPVKRKVAIKLINAGMDTRQVLGRFEAERQALALMEHPNIAKIYDGGVTASGRPFFAMELVKGIMVTEYCDQCQLTVGERLSLFGQICSAVQHAHQKGLIHRDLKPSNILVSEFDGNPICKVIDFGLAKAVQGTQSLTEISMQTAFGAVIGTPMYMAPEQLRVSQQDVDTRADLYSLGVILYELLTGTTPIERDRLKKAAWDEVLRMIREEDPPTPSQRLSSSDSLTSVAARRHIEPLRLTKLVKGELDWIIMKALDKNRNRRYESASGFGADIQRYLAGESVLAAPPSRLYNARKFVARNRGLVSIVLLLFLTLVAGILGTTYGLYHARLSAIAEGLAKTDAQNRQKEAEQQRTRAEAHEQQAIGAVKRFGDAVRKNPELKNNPSLGELRKTLLQEPINFFQSLREELESGVATNPKSLERLADIAFDLGELTLDIGNKQDAIAVIENALKIRQQLLERDAKNSQSVFVLGASHTQLGWALFEIGKHDQALEHYTQTIKLLEPLSDIPELRAKALQVLSRGYSNIGILHAKIGQTDNAMQAHRTAIENVDKLLATNPDDEVVLCSATHYRQNLANILADVGQTANALIEYEHSISIAERLVNANPDTDRYQALLRDNLRNQSLVLQELGRTEEAISILRRVLEMGKTHAKKSPTNTEYRYDLASIYFALGTAYEELRQMSQAMQAMDSCIEISEKITSENPEVPDFQTLLASGYKLKGKWLAIEGEISEARRYYQRALEIREKAVEKTPSVLEYRRDLALSYRGFGSLLIRTDQQAAKDAYEKALRLLEGIVNESPSISDNHYWLAAILMDLSNIEFQLAIESDAKKHILEAEDHNKIAMASSPNSIRYQELQKKIFKKMLSCQAPEFSSRAMAGLSQMVKSEPGASFLESRISTILNSESTKELSELLSVAEYCYRTFRYALAAQLYGAAIELEPTVTGDRKSEVRYNAACCAALAANGRGYLEPLEDQTKDQFRRQAIAWLRSELADWKKELEANSLMNQKFIFNSLTHWKSDSDLAGLREPVYLEKLVDGEVQECHSLWKEVEELLQIASQTKSQEIQQE